MVLEPILCPCCQSDDAVKYGQSSEGKQRYQCRNSDCSRQTILAYSYRAYLLEVKQQISDMAMNSSGIRDTARVLKISPTTVIKTIKKSPRLNAIKEKVLAQLQPCQTIVRLCQWEPTEAELDEMWSYVRRKKQERWLWHAIDYDTGTVLAYVLSNHKDSAFIALKALLKPFRISQFYTDGWGAYQRHLSPAHHSVGKCNTQKIERKHLTLRTRVRRLVRKTICFSKTIVMHDTVIGLFINRFEFGLDI